MDIPSKGWLKWLGVAAAVFTILAAASQLDMVNGLERFLASLGAFIGNIVATALAPLPIPTIIVAAVVIWIIVKVGRFVYSLFNEDLQLEPQKTDFRGVTLIYIINPRNGLPIIRDRLCATCGGLINRSTIDVYANVQILCENGHPIGNQRTALTEGLDSVFERFFGSLEASFAHTLRKQEIQSIKRVELNNSGPPNDAP